MFIRNGAGIKWNTAEGISPNNILIVFAMFKFEIRVNLKFAFAICSLFVPFQRGPIYRASARLSRWSRGWRGEGLTE